MAKGGKPEPMGDDMGSALDELGATVIEEQSGEVAKVIDGEVVSDSDLNPWGDPEQVFASSELLAITSVEDLESKFADKGIEGSEGEEIRTGFEEGFEKSDLVGTPFTFVSWKFTQSTVIEVSEETGKPEVRVTRFVYATLITDGGIKGYLTDGSGYGVHDQLLRISRSRAANPRDGVHPAMYLKCPKGLGEKQNRRGKPTYVIAHLN